MATAGATRIPILELSAVTEIPTATKMAVFGDPDGNGIRLLGYMDMGSGFVPLGGTEVGKPITGDLELDKDIYAIKLFQTDEIEYSNEVRFMQDEGFGFIRKDLENNEESGVKMGNASVVIYSEKSDFSGMTGNLFYNKQNDPKTFAQLGDIAEVNATATPLSLATLNADYATQGAGFRVCCPNLNLDYIKDTLTTWHSVATTTVV